MSHPRILRFLRLAIAAGLMASAAVTAGHDLLMGRFTASNLDRQRNLYVAWDRQFVDTSGGKGLLLVSHHLSGPYLKLRSELYYRAVYVLYPQPVFLDEPHDDAWLQQHGVGGILTLKPAPLEIAVESSSRVQSSTMRTGESAD